MLRYIACIYVCDDTVCSLLQVHPLLMIVGFIMIGGEGRKEKIHHYSNWIRLLPPIVQA